MDWGLASCSDVLSAECSEHLPFDAACRSMPHRTEASSRALYIIVRHDEPLLMFSTC